MRIAYISGPFPSLSQTFVLNQITGLVERGHSVQIFSPDPGPLEKIHPDVLRYELLDQVHYWPGPADAARLMAERPLGTSGLFARAAAAAFTSRERWPFSLAIKALEASRHDPYDVIVCHFGHLGREAQMLRDMGALRGPLVTVFHGYDMSVYLRERGLEVYDRLFRTGDLFLPISHHWRKKLLEMGAPSALTRVHRMGIDSDLFQFTERRPDADGKVRMLTIGRLVEKKGIEYGLRALARLAPSRPNLYLTLVGNGPLHEPLAALVRELGIEDRVTFAGWMGQDEIVEQLARHHFLLAPSVVAENGDTEGIPVVLMEAMAMGLPVVSTLHSGIPELVADERSGYLVPERDVDALARRIDDLASAPERWPQMGREGRRIVEQEFAIDALNDRLEAILQQVAAGDALKR